MGVLGWNQVIFILPRRDIFSLRLAIPKEDDKPNKKYYDPRVWLERGEKSLLLKRLNHSAFEDLNCINRNA
jgi:fructose-bisphosphate aldolase, class II